MKAQIIQNVMEEEGGYVNLTTDAGGETYRGIARNFQPTWEGWLSIDARKKQGTIPRYWTNAHLDVLCYPFYERYWTKYSLEKFRHDLQYALFDSFVMSGLNTYGIIREAANFQKWDKSEAGVYEIADKITLDALMLSRRDYFLYIARLSANYAVSLKGWLERLTRVYSRSGGLNSEVLQALQYTER